MKDTRRYSVLIIDDHPLFRQGVAQLVEGDEGLVLAGEAASGAEGIALAEQMNPDLILLDLNMNEMNGLEVLQELKRRGCESKVIILTVSDAEDDLVTALRSGAQGYLLKDMEPEDMLAKMAEAAQGKVVMADSLKELLPHALQKDRPAKRFSEASLTEREHQILALIAEGKSNKLIARELGISDGTVKVHIRNLMGKLQQRSRLEVAVWYLRQQRQGR